MSRLTNAGLCAGSGLIAAVCDAEPVGILAHMGRVDAMVLRAAPRLRAITKHGAGVDNIGVDATKACGIPVLNAAGANAVSVVEHRIALLFAVCKRAIPVDRSIRDGRREKSGFEGRERAGSVMDLVAFGAIARQTACFAMGLGIDVRACDPFTPADAFAAEGIERIEDLDALFADSDIVSLHSPLTPATRHVVNAERLALMKPDAIVINAPLSAALARGQVDILAGRPGPSTRIVNRTTLKITA